MSGTRPPANRMMLMQFKARVVGAKKGHKLLKQKRDALKARFQQMMRVIIETKKESGTALSDCWFSLAKTKYAAESDIGGAVIAQVKRPNVTTKMKSENVAGVQLPKFIVQNDANRVGGMNTDNIGITCGGAVIQQCKDVHLHCLEALIRLAGLQTSFITLDREIQMTSRRVNALEYVLIPRIEDTVSWIKGEMDELEREEFFRVKKVVEKKKQRTERERLAELAEEAEAAAAGFKPKARGGGGAKGGRGQQQSALGQKDQDILF